MGALVGVHFRQRWRPRQKSTLSRKSAMIFLGPPRFSGRARACPVCGLALGVGGIVTADAEAGKPAAL